MPENSDVKEWEERLLHLLRLADEASPETIKGLGFTEDVQLARLDRDERIQECAHRLSPIGIDLVALLREKGYLKPRAKRARKPGKRRAKGTPQVLPAGQVEEPYRTAGRRAQSQAPRKGQVMFEVFKRRHVMVLSVDDRQVRTACRYFRRQPGQRNWWYTVSRDDLRDADFVCFLLCDGLGRMLHAVMVPTAWLETNKAHLSRPRRSGHQLCIYDDPEGLVIRRGGWRQEVSQWKGNWKGLWRRPH